MRIMTVVTLLLALLSLNVNFCIADSSNLTKHHPSWTKLDSNTNSKLTKLDSNTDSNLNKFDSNLNKLDGNTDSNLNMLVSTNDGNSTTLDPSTDADIDSILKCNYTREHF